MIKKKKAELHNFFQRGSFHLLPIYSGEKQNGGEGRGLLGPLPPQGGESGSEEGTEGMLFCLLRDPNAPASASHQPPRTVAQGCLFGVLRSSGLLRRV